MTDPSCKQDPMALWSDDRWRQTRARSQSCRRRLIEVLTQLGWEDVDRPVDLPHATHPLFGEQAGQRWIDAAQDVCDDTAWDRIYLDIHPYMGTLRRTGWILYRSDTDFVEWQWLYLDDRTWWSDTALPKTLAPRPLSYGRLRLSEPMTHWRLFERTSPPDASCVVLTNSASPNCSPVDDLESAPTHAIHPSRTFEQTWGLYLTLWVSTIAPAHHCFSDIEHAEAWKYDARSTPSRAVWTLVRPDRWGPDCGPWIMLADLDDETLDRLRRVKNRTVFLSDASGWPLWNAMSSSIEASDRRQWLRTLLQTSTSSGRWGHSMIQDT